LDISEGHVYVLRDVIFDETVYPFSKLNPNAGAWLREELSLILTINCDGVCLTNPALINVSNQHVEIAEPIASVDSRQRIELNSEETRENSGENGAQRRDFVQEGAYGGTEGDLVCESSLDHIPA
jgi:hypothetical protein